MSKEFLSEEAVLDFWQKNKIFEKSLALRRAAPTFIFYDGPPFATGLPHYGHLLQSTIKDVIPRYQTMKGKLVERRWGWDCHGLPVELEVEKESGEKNLQQKISVAEFNERCRQIVLRYDRVWKKTINRIGRWVDYEHSYKTMDKGYMESVWWAFKQLYDQGLIYHDYRPGHICPRCQTILSDYEVSLGYKEITEPSVVVKFQLPDSKQEYFLAWTTTPWTLPGNTLLAVGKDIVYAKIQQGDNLYWLAAAKVKEIIKGDYQELTTVTGAELVNKKYIPLLDYYKNTPNAFRVVVADFVSTEDGTGIVHIAPAFGQEDFNLGKQENIELVQHITLAGEVKKEVSDFSSRDVQQLNNDILKKIVSENKVYAIFDATHSYPHCWRCQTPLLNYATKSWFVNIQKIKPRLIINNQSINWVPAYIKDGRFGNGLQEAPDWAISRSRFWGTPLPVWICQNCHSVRVIGSVAELEKLSGKKITDIHKHFVDEIIFPCEQCHNEMRRIPEILDCWFESGAMPFAQGHWPFVQSQKLKVKSQNSQKLRPENFPADFIAEAQDQTRGWFYFLHVLATALFAGPAFKNVVVTGIILAEDGKKMSKSLKNYPDPEEILKKYGADTLRFYLLSSPVTKAESLNFNERNLDQIYKKNILILRNCLNFFTTYSQIDRWNYQSLKSQHILDRWLIARLHELIAAATADFNQYDFNDYCRQIEDFISDLSLWYIRRSRQRRSNDFYSTCREVFYKLAQIMAPLTPFLAESIYQTLKTAKDPSSVHLTDWPLVDKKLIDKKLITEMATIREMAGLGLAKRAAAGIKIRQPLSKLTITSQVLNVSQDKNELLKILTDEINVTKIEITAGGRLTVDLDIKITNELRRQGEYRELLRQIQEARKKACLRPGESATLLLPQSSRQLVKAYTNQLKKAAAISKIDYHDQALAVAKNH